MSSEKTSKKQICQYITIPIGYESNHTYLYAHDAKELDTYPNILTIWEEFALNVMEKGSVSYNYPLQNAATL